MHEYPVEELAADIARCASPEEFDRTAQSTLHRFDQIIEHADVKVHCHAGCSLCCSLRVDVFAHEVFLIARHIREHFTSEDLSALLVRLAEHTSRVSLLTPFEHATTNIQCALLGDGRCSIYSVRPHCCRRHHSKDFAACQYTFDHPADLAAPAAHDRVLYKELTSAMQQNIDAFSTLEFDYTIYELGTALDEALNDPSCWQHWLNHEEAFVRASVTPAG
jgi:Fe-S-cluster containining protein